MNSKNDSQKPYLNLGTKLKQMREKNNESLNEVSGAVEIDSVLLAKYESGLTRPSEDILMLLISHFKVRGEVASSLWQLAGYNAPENPGIQPSEQINIRHDIVIIPVDPRAIYSDKAQIQINDTGVVLSFMQSSSKASSIPVAKIGMSKKQAKNLLNVLSVTLRQSELQNRTRTDETPKK